MFTGLITDIGVVERSAQGQFSINCSYPHDGIDLGASISCDGCCLTVTGCKPSGSGGSVFDVDVTNETLDCTTLGAWGIGRRINLERPLTPSTELGGHIVSGHIDGVAEIIEREKDGASLRVRLRCPDNLAAFIAPKGSVALDGTSLTVNDVDGAQFGINIIPHTLAETNWGTKQPGDLVNLEVDLLARYVARITEVLNSRSQ